MQKLIYIENDYDGQYGAFWAHLGEICLDRDRFLSDPESFDLVCFTGGEDVSPELYGHKNLASHNSPGRDKREVVVFEMAKKHNVPMTGICRGSQFLNVMCGGTLIQDFRGHPVPHMQRVLETGETMRTACSHHQIVVPGPGCEILAIQNEVIAPRYTYDGELPQVMLEGESLRVTEAYAYPKQRIFATQHHPEWQSEDERTYQWTLEMVRKYCWDQDSLTVSAS